MKNTEIENNIAKLKKELDTKMLEAGTASDPVYMVYRRTFGKKAADERFLKSREGKE